MEAVLDNLLDHGLADRAEDRLHLRGIDGAREVVEHAVFRDSVKLHELTRHVLLRILGVVAASIVREARPEWHLFDLLVEQIDLNAQKKISGELLTSRTALRTLLKKMMNGILLNH